MNLWWEGVITRCPEGSVFVIQPGMYYLPHAAVSGEAPQDHSVIWLALHRGCAVVHHCVLQGEWHRLGEYYCFTDPQVTGLARSITQELGDRSAHYAVAIRGCLLCLFTYLVRASAQPLSRIDTPDFSPHEVARADAFSASVEAYLLSHYHRPLSLQQVARAVGCSPAYLCRRFRTSTGQTPFGLLRAVRIEAAKRLLRSEVPIARVAEMVGFDDPFYFSRVFSAAVGESPQGYRAHFLVPSDER
jgi:AraC-like DNA-binding protein